jgi:glycosyltransferase involved in cell wall biosynthesis
MKNNYEGILSGSKIVIATHEFETGFSQYLEEYLKDNKISNLLYLHHPLYLSGKKKSGYRIYKNGRLLKEDSSAFNAKNSLLSYVFDITSNVYWAFKSGIKWDLYIGSNNLNSFSGLVLKKLGIVKKCVFYTVDFVPNRFQNKLLNNFYLWIDKVCVKYCDETWIVSPRMIEGRHTYLKLSKKYDKKQILVPEGVWIERIKKFKFSQIDKNCAVFVGHLVERIGIQEVIKAVPFVVKVNPKFKLIIIGAGEYEKKLKSLVKTLGMRNHVQFTGYIKDHRDVETIIAKCAIGIACYKKDKSSFTFYAEPSKTKVYMGAGLPVVMTDMFYNAKEIENFGAGKIVSYDASSIAVGIMEIITNENSLKTYKEKANEYIKNYDWELIFKKNLYRILSD